MRWYWERLSIGLCGAGAGASGGVQERDAAQSGRGQLTNSHTPNLGNKPRLVLVLVLDLGGAAGAGASGRGCRGLWWWAGRLFVASERARVAVSVCRAEARRNYLSSAQLESRAIGWLSKCNTLQRQQG